MAPIQFFSFAAKALLPTLTRLVGLCCLGAESLPSAGERPVAYLGVSPRRWDDPISYLHVCLVHLIPFGLAEY